MSSLVLETLSEIRCEDDDDNDDDNDDDDDDDDNNDDDNEGHAGRGGLHEDARGQHPGKLSLGCHTSCHSCHPGQHREPDHHAD